MALTGDKCLDLDCHLVGARLQREEAGSGFSNLARPRDGEALEALEALAKAFFGRGNIIYTNLS